MFRNEASGSNSGGKWWAWPDSNRRPHDLRMIVYQSCAPAKLSYRPFASALSAFCFKDLFMATSERIRFRARDYFRVLAVYRTYAIL